MKRRFGSFVAVDVETADAQRDSICSLAAVRVDDGQITRRFCSLVRPPRDEVTLAWVHGLTWEKLRIAPKLREVWPSFLDMCDGVSCLVAHNIGFDRSVIEASSKASRLRCPDLEWHCTLQMARETWPRIKGHGLADLSRRFGIPLIHHDALSDAEACARIALKFI